MRRQRRTGVRARGLPERTERSPAFHRRRLGRFKQASGHLCGRVDDFSRAHVTVGEAVGLLHDAPAAAVLIERITNEAKRLLLNKS